MPKIMVVDDAMFMRKMIIGALKDEGFADFEEAGDGEEAIALYRKARPDLVLLDITMPVKSGLAALREILEADPEARVVMCAAIGQEDLLTEAVKRGARDFIVKPLTPYRIAQAVKNALI